MSSEPLDVEGIEEDQPRSVTHLYGDGELAPAAVVAEVEEERNGIPTTEEVDNMQPHPQVSVTVNQEEEEEDIPIAVQFASSIHTETVHVSDDDDDNRGGMDLGSSRITGMPLPPALLDRILKQSLQKATINQQEGGGTTSTTATAPPTVLVAKDARLAVHKAANVFVMMLGALVEDLRIQKMTEAASASSGGGIKRGAGSAASKRKAQEAAAQRLKNGLVTSKDVEEALVAAGFGHFLPRLAQSKREREV